MIVMKGQYNVAKIMCDEIDETTKEQIQNFLNCPLFKGENISIMPDTHAGAGTVIGFTSTFKNGLVIPNVIGVDIGCGIYAYNLGKIDIDYQKLEDFIRQHIPTGSSKANSYEEWLSNMCVEIPKRSNAYTKFVSWIDSYIRNYFNNPFDYLSTSENICQKLSDDRDYLNHTDLSTNSLGGGNHFIEIDKDDSSNMWLCIHCGSRNLGHKIATYHQNKAKEQLKLFYQNNPIFKDLEFLPMDYGGKEYVEDMKFAQNYAHLNRSLIAYNIIQNFFGIDYKSVDRIETVHNYINFNDGIIRKGAISAHKDQRVLIPINMRDGVIVGKGKGNKDWNFSAPHGSGRILSRRKARENLSLDDYKKQMDGIWSGSVSKSTLDEAPDAYKSIDFIMDNIKDSIDVDFVMKPVYNLKGN